MTTKQKMQSTSEAEDEGGFSSRRLRRWSVTEIKYVHKNYEEQQTLIQNEETTLTLTNHTYILSKEPMLIFCHR